VHPQEPVADQPHSGQDFLALHNAILRHLLGAMRKQVALHSVTDASGVPIFVKTCSALSRYHGVVYSVLSASLFEVSWTVVAISWSRKGQELAKNWPSCWLLIVARTILNIASETTM